MDGKCGYCGYCKSLFNLYVCEQDGGPCNSGEIKIVEIMQGACPWFIPSAEEFHEVYEDSELQKLYNRS